MGYENFHSIRSRVFVFSLHSETECSVTVRGALETDLCNRSHIAASCVQDEFTVTESITIDKIGIRALSSYNRLADVFTVVAVNDLTYAVELTIDASQTTAALFSTCDGRARKRLEPGQMELMMHLKADPTQNLKFKLKYKCTCIGL